MNRIKFILPVSFAFLVLFLSAGKVSAASLNNAKDTISTSRPSAASSLVAGYTAPITQITITENGSRYIASDSAKLLGGTLEAVTIASMSAANYPSANQRVLYFTGVTAQNHGIGTTVHVPITAKHTVNFRTIGSIPLNGKIRMIFPVGEATNQAWPSATGFSFNNLAGQTGPTAPNISVTGMGAAGCSSWTVTASTGTIDCVVSAGVTGSANITINIGSTTPILINPTKAAGAGTADTWGITIKTLDSGGAEIDYAKIKIATIESVEVYATVDPTLTFTIGGIVNATAVNTGNTACTNSEVVNTGFDSSATEVNLGVLGPSQMNISAQLMTVSTNGGGGYSLTATSSGHLIDSDIGYWIADAQGTPTNNDLPVPAYVNAGTPAFGIHACGNDVVAGTWGTGVTGGSNAKYANPSPAYYYILAADTTGPIIGASGNGMTTVEYAATISTAVPAGSYHTVLTYVATPSF